MKGKLGIVCLWVLALTVPSGQPAAGLQPAATAAHPAEQLSAEPDSLARRLSHPSTVTDADAANVELIGQVGGTIYTVASQGSYVYAGIGPRMVILDISNPSEPSLVGQSSPLPGLVYAIAVAGNYAYLIDSEGNLWVVDVSNPAAPTEIGFCDLPDSMAVAVSGEYAYVVGWYAGLRVIDVSNPAAPVVVGFYAIQGNGWDVAAAGDYAYATNTEGELYIIDVSNAAEPIEVGFYDTLNAESPVAIAGDYAYLAGWRQGMGNLHILDVSDPAAPAEVGFLQLDDPVDVAVAGNYAYVAEYAAGLSVVDVSDPAAPTRVGLLSAPGVAYQVAAVGDYAYVGDLFVGLLIVDASEPAAPAQVGIYHAWYDAVGVATDGNLAYLATTASGLRVVDVSNPAAPAELGFLDTPGIARGVAAKGNYAYVTDGLALRVVDVSDPAAPVEVGSVDIGGSPVGVAVAGNYAYVAAAYGGLHVVDISNPAAPADVGSCDSPGFGVAVAGNYAYIADWFAGLRIVEVSNPASPTEVGFPGLPGYAWGVAVAGGHAYVASGWAGLRVVAIMDPANPVEVGFYDTYSAQAVTVAGDYAYLADGADGEAGLRVVEVVDPANPVEAGFYDTQYAQDVAVTGGRAFLADASGGLYILHFIPRYTASGVIELADGTPLPGVTVSAGPGGDTITGATGVYTITDLISGTYTLTPTLATYTFSPPTRAVTGPPDVVGQDFLALPVPLAGIEITGPTTGTVGVTYWFTATAGPPASHLPVTYAWQATGQAPITRTDQATLTDWISYTWAIGGIQTITVTAANASASVTDTHQITLPHPVGADFTAAPLQGPAPLTVAFTNTSTGDYDTTLWSFGDGITSTLDHPVHDYVLPGVYTVTLTVTGPGGTDTETRPDYITVYEPVEAGFAAVPREGLPPLTVVFTNTSTGDYDASLWHFGDGLTSTLQHPTHDYELPGAYTVTLTASGPGGTDTLTRTRYITVYMPVAARFSASPTTGPAPLTVVFTNTSTGDYDTAFWTFGDGLTSTLPSPIHLYPAAGSYTVTLTITGPGGADTELKPACITVWSGYEIYLPVLLR
jgi:PKD repeat protein